MVSLGIFPKQVTYLIRMKIVQLFDRISKIINYNKASFVLGNLFFATDVQEISHPVLGVYTFTFLL